MQRFSVLLAASPPLQGAFDPVSCQQVFDFACVSFSHSVGIGHTIPSPCRRFSHRPCQAYSGPPAPPPSSLSRCEAWSCRNGLSPTSWTPRPCWARSSITNTLAPERPRRSSSICTSSITVCRRQWSWVAFRSSWRMSGMNVRGASAGRTRAHVAVNRKAGTSSSGTAGGGRSGTTRVAAQDH